DRTMAYEDHERALDAALRELADSFGNIIKSSGAGRKRDSLKFRSSQERLTLQTEAANVVRSTEQILTIIDILKQSLLLHDYSAMARQLAERRVTLEESSDQDLERRANLSTSLDNILRRLEKYGNMSSMFAGRVSGGGATAHIAKMLDPVEVNKRFEEWMKIAADGKITSANSWNVALIDYFADLDILREERGEINFQKVWREVSRVAGPVFLLQDQASCTLDASVKVYTTRVDSVATETGKLLSGLAESRSDPPRRGDEEDNNGERATTRVKGPRSTNTLEKEANLDVKKYDLEFTVDPLFKKTCADFDE
ncbi:hypothetical protein HDU93_004060, partial [Gonapodya sp. JEL0774]